MHDIMRTLPSPSLQVEESAKKSIEAASSGSAILKLYNKWHEKLAAESMEEEGRTRIASGKEKKGLLSKVKASIQSKEKTKVRTGATSRCRVVDGGC